MNKTISQIFPIDTKLFFKGGNFLGHEGVVISVEENSKDSIAVFGFIINVTLDDGREVKVEKS